MGLCYLLIYPLEITTFRNQNHILEHFWIFWPYFWIFPTFGWLKKSTRANVLLNNFWTCCGIMLFPLLSSWNKHLLRSESHFGTFLEFGRMFLDFSNIGWKSPLEQMFCWITSGLAVGLCYLLFYPLQITTFRDQNHILGDFSIFCLYFFIFPALAEKVH